MIHSKCKEKCLKYNQIRIVMSGSLVFASSNLLLIGVEAILIKGRVTIIVIKNLKRCNTLIILLSMLWHV